MSRSFGYSAAGDDDDDSDLDLDIQELGPGIGGGYGRAYGGRASEDDEIPLQAYGRSERGRNHLPTDSLGGESTEGAIFGDGVPLLRPEQGQQDGKREASTTGLASKLRIPSFSGKSQLALPVAPAQQETDDGAGQRVIDIGDHPPTRFPQNAVSNAKYSPWSFLPLTLWQEFKFFINMYFLLIALSQLIPALQIGRLWTYFAPLIFVLCISLGKEAFDDLTRRRRDTEANNELYTMLALRGTRFGSSRRTTGKRTKRKSAGQPRLEAIDEEESALDGNGRNIDAIPVRARDIRVGDVLKLEKNQRVPADVVILKSTVPVSTANGLEETGEPEGNGEAFIRTDQLDGETDWKLRIASPLTQDLDLFSFKRITVTGARPSKNVNEFLGKIELQPEGNQVLYDQAEEGVASGEQQSLTASLSIDNTAWANTVLASNAVVLAVVVYTGSQTRQALSTSSPRSKVGKLEVEINNITKILCVLSIVLSAVMTGLQNLNKSGPEHPWYISIFRFIILFSVMIPISLRVNLDLGKTVYAHFIHKDAEIPGAVVRTSTIPEDLGRIEYLLSDKTGTLTQNEMDLRKIHIGTVSYANDAMEEVSSYIRQGFATVPNGSLVTPSNLLQSTATSGTRTKREIGGRVRDIVLALALCHNVTPTAEEMNGETIIGYQASSPDEIAIVQWTESVGLRLVQRDRHSMALESVETSQIVVRVKILDMFPFTSESKRMGIVLQYQEVDDQDPSKLKAGEIWFYQKGADTIMTKIVAANDWLDEETANMAREGLRTLVAGRRKLSPEQYREFATSYKAAATSLQHRDANMASAVSKYLEQNLELLGVTGVEDKLQTNVKSSLELLRNAGIKIWMLTGDKVETARCVAVSSKLVSRTQTIQSVTNLAKLARDSPTAATDALALLSTSPATTALLIDGDSLSYLLNSHRIPFITLAVRLPAVIACRCSPTQKADIALLIRSFTGKRVACIGDGGNDVSMIQAADVGVGIVGKEGRQASLAADFSITQFQHLSKLLVWHGRNSYKRSAKLAQFVMHRGLLLAIAQLAYSLFAGPFTSEGLATNWLLIAYATAYTQWPVFSFVLDTDVDERLAKLYPELYKELITRGKQALSYRTTGIWFLVTVYQGLIIQLLSQLLVQKVSTKVDTGDGVMRPQPNPKMLAVSYTALILNELLMVAVSITSWHWIMATTIVLTAALYAASVPFLGAFFDLSYVWSWGWAWRLAAIVGISIVPVYVSKIAARTIRPPSYRKVRGV